MNRTTVAVTFALVATLMIPLQSDALLNGQSWVENYEVKRIDKFTSIIHMNQAYLNNEELQIKLDLTGFTWGKDHRPARPHWQYEKLSGANTTATITNEFDEIVDVIKAKSVYGETKIIKDLRNYTQGWYDVDLVSDYGGVVVKQKTRFHVDNFFTQYINPCIG